MISRIQNKLNSDKHLVELIKGGSISFIFQVAGIGLSYLFILLVSRFYGAEGMGIFALSFSVLNIFVLFGKFGLDISSVKFIGERSETKKYGGIKDIYLKILTIAIPVNIVLTIVLFIVAPYLAEYLFNKPNLTIYFQLISLGILPMSLRFIHANAIRGMRNIKVFSFLQNITMYFFALIILGVLSSLNRESNSYPIVSLLFGLCIGVIFSIYFWLKESNFLWHKRIPVLSIKEILAVSTPLLLSSSIMLILGLADTIMLGMFKTESDVGVYNVAYKIATVGMIVFMAMSSISIPKIAVAYSENNISKLRKIIVQTTKLIAIVSIPITLVICMFSTQLLGLFGNAFIRGGLSLILLAIGFMIKSLLGTSEQLLQMSDQQKSLIRFAIMAATLNIILNFMLIPEFGIEGASFSSMVSIIVYHVMLTIRVQKVFNILSISRIKK